MGNATLHLFRINKWRAQNGVSNEFQNKTQVIGSNHSTSPLGRSKIGRPRVPYYGTEDQKIIKLVWSAANFIASKGLAPFLNELIPALKRYGHLNLTDETRDKITSTSAATIDRILISQRKHFNGRRISTTKPVTLLR